MKYTTATKAATAVFAEFKRRGIFTFDDKHIKKLNEHLKVINLAAKKVRATTVKIKAGRDIKKTNTLITTLKNEVWTLKGKGYALNDIGEEVHYALKPPMIRSLGMAGGVKAWQGFLKTLPEGWSVDVSRGVGANKTWFMLKVPMKSFTQEYKGAKATFSWIQIAIGITGDASAHFKIGFQTGKKHLGGVKSPHPHVDEHGGLCKGSGASAINAAVTAWNIIGLYAVLHSLLTTTHYGGHSYYQPEDFTGKQGGRCSNCEWWYTLRTLKTGEKCTKCSSYICKKCVEKMKKTPFFSACPKCATAGKSKWRKENKERKNEGKEPLPYPIKCRNCTEAHLYYCENSECSVPRGQRKLVVCSKHRKVCRYCSKILCIPCQKKNRCKICKTIYCSNHMVEDSGCCVTCRSNYPDKVKVYMNGKKKTEKKTETKITIETGGIAYDYETGTSEATPAAF